MEGQKARKRLDMGSRYAFGWTLLIVLVLLVRYFDIQMIRHTTYAKRFDHQVQSERVLQSPRGTIYDRNGSPLAMSIDVNSVALDPTMMRLKGVSPEEVARELAPFVRISEEEIIKRAKEDTSFIWIDRLLDMPESMAVEKLRDTKKWDFIALSKESRRHYPNHTLLAPVLGFVGFNESGEADAEGKEGLEAVLDDIIRGSSKHLKISIDRDGNPIFESVSTDFIAAPEKSVRLTIDTTVQFIVERALEKTMAQTKAKSATMIIMDPKTGEILAMANHHKGMAEDINKLRYSDYRNNGVAMIYEPGSTMKPLVAASALAAGTWKLDEVYNDTGVIVVSGHPMKNWDGEGNGKVKLLDILKYSINTGMAQIGLKTGSATLMGYIEKFGFGKATDIELPAEGEGILKDPKDMSDLDLATVSIGQTIAVTPLQMVQAFGALANGGTMMKPHIVKAIYNSDGTLEEEKQPVQKGQPIPTTVAKQITDILEKEVSEGGGQRAYVEGYQFAGKTGTAEKIDADHGGYLEGRYISSFVGYGPVEDAKFVALVVIDDPEGVYYGGQIAAPVFQEVMTQLVRYYKLSPTQSKKMEAPKEESTEALRVVRNEEGMISIPDFTGRAYGEVRNWMHDSGLVFKPVGSGFAISQDKEIGTYVEPGSTVTVYFDR